MNDFGRLEIEDYRRATGRASRPRRSKLAWLAGLAFGVGLLVPSPLRLTSSWSFERSLEATLSERPDERRLGTAGLMRRFLEGMDALRQVAPFPGPEGRDAVMYLGHVCERAFLALRELAESETPHSSRARQWVERIRKRAK